MNKIFLFLSAVFTLLVLFVPPVFAGGGPVFLMPVGNPNGWNDNDRRTISLSVHLDPSVPCAGTKVTFNFENKENGDSVTSGAEGNTFTIQEAGRRWVNGKSVYDCSTYAKYTSTNKQLKYALVTVVTPGGETHERKTALNFQLNEPVGSSEYSLPWDSEPAAKLEAPGLELTKEGQLTNKNQTRSVKLRLGQVSGATAYTIFVRESGKDNWEENSSGSYSNTAWAYVNPNKDYVLKARVCANDRGCSDFSNEVFLSRMKEEVLVTKIVQPSGSPRLTTSTPKPIVTSEPIASTSQIVNPEIKQLSQKISNLEKQLAQSQKKQSALEQRIDQLMKWISSIFPFFK